MTLLLLACTGTTLPLGKESAEIPQDSGSPTPAEVHPPTPVIPTVTIDEDRDGYEPPRGGGADCDDADPDIHPDAVELCDGIDQDCDGEALSPGGCANQPIDPVSTELLYSSVGGWPIIVSDLTGDGQADLVLATPEDVIENPDGEEDGAWVVFPGGPDLPRNGRYPDGAVAIFSLDDGTAWWPNYARLDVGDVNGDGFNDLGVVIAAESPGLYLHFGPFGGGAQAWVRDADAVWTSPNPSNGWGEYAFAADFDEDGRSDAVLGMYTHDAPEPIAFNVFFGGEYAWGDYVSVRDPSGTPDSANALLGDVDGDGVPEIATTNQGITFWISGADLRHIDGVFDSDAALTAISAAADGDRGQASAVVDAGDLDDDGYADVATTFYAQDPDSGEDSVGLLYFSGSLRGSVGPSSAAGAYLSPDPETFTPGSELRHCDIDGDDLPELWVQGVARSEDDAQLGWYILDGTLPIPGPNTDFPFTTALTLTYSATVNLSCTDLDLTGDGIPDAAFWDPDEKKIGLYEGWDIPWGNPNW